MIAMETLKGYMTIFGIQVKQCAVLQQAQK